MIEFEEEEQLRNEKMDKFEQDFVKMARFEDSFKSGTFSSNKNVGKKKGKSSKFIPGISEEDEDTKLKKRIIMEHVNKLENDEYSYLNDE